MLLPYFLYSFSGWVMASMATEEALVQPFATHQPGPPQEELQDNILSPDAYVFIREALGDDEKQTTIMTRALELIWPDPTNFLGYTLGCLMQYKFAAKVSLEALQNTADWKTTDMKSLFLKPKDDSDFASMLILDLAKLHSYGSATTEYVVLGVISELRQLAANMRIYIQVFRKTAARNGQFLEDKEENLARISSIIGAVFDINRSYLEVCQRLRFFLRLRLRMLCKGGEDTKNDKDNEEASRKWRLLYRTISRNNLRPIRVTLEEATRHLPWLYLSLFVNSQEVSMHSKQPFFVLPLEGPCSPAQFSDAPRSLREWQRCLQKYAEDGRLHDHVRRELLNVKCPAPLLHTLKLDTTTPRRSLLGFVMAHAMAVARRERFWLERLLADPDPHYNSGHDYYGGEDGKINAQDREERPVLNTDDWKVVADVEHAISRSISWQ
jgi:hypothetical protein